MTDPVPMIKPEEFKVAGPDGELTFVLSNFNAIDGRRIAATYPMSGLPKIGDYDLNEKTYFLIMSHVAVRKEGRDIRLTTPTLIANHIPDFEVGAKVEIEMMRKNFSFFRDGRLQGFFEALTQMVLAKISETLTRSSEQSSPAEKQPSTNSEQSTTSKMQ